MCGIVGYVGPEEAVPVLLDGMRMLEYRGYDSAGVAIATNSTLTVVKKAGQIDSGLGPILDREAIRGLVGIGHTRWATHGTPNDLNAHPHVDCSGRIAVVHNGIIENHDVIKRRLLSEGHTFASETDSEMVAHLLEEALPESGCLREALLRAVAQLNGTFALVCISTSDPGKIMVARRDAPLIVGASDHAGLVASDIPALLPHTRDVIPLENEQIAEVRAGSVRVFDFAGVELKPEHVHVGWDLASAEKSGFDDFMLKEIFEQPDAVRRTLMGRVSDGQVVIEGPGWDPALFGRVERISIVACGTSFHAGMAAKQAIERWTRIPVELDLASEFRCREPILDGDSLVICIAQSGETADTLAAARYAGSQGATVVAITNVMGSSITREADAVLFTHAGPEVGVAATKTFLCQLVAVNLLGLYIAQAQGATDAPRIAEIVEALIRLPEQIEETLLLSDGVLRAAKRYAAARDVLFIGRGAGHAVAMEGALKLKEISYLHAEGYAAGELKHGALALVEPGVPVVAILTDLSLYDKMLANVEEVRARGADTILIARRGSERALSLANELFEVQGTEPMLAPIIDTIPLQLFAYYVAKERGLSPDKPRNLAKSVTVE